MRNTASFLHQISHEVDLRINKLKSGTEKISGQDKKYINLDEKLAESITEFETWIDSYDDLSEITEDMFITHAYVCLDRLSHLLLDFNPKGYTKKEGRIRGARKSFFKKNG